MTTTYPSYLLFEMTEALGQQIDRGLPLPSGPFRRIDFHSVADGTRAVVRDMSNGQDYEITVKPMNWE